MVGIFSGDVVGCSRDLVVRDLESFWRSIFIGVMELGVVKVKNWLRGF